MTTATKLFEEALRLDEPERARLALTLMDSLSRPDSTDEGEWIEEIERRARRALSGESQGTALDEALDRIDRDLGL
jgi:putative addiction module component